MSFGTKLKDARKAKKLTQKELASKIGAAHNSVSNWENDQNKPDPDTIQNLCWVLGVQPNYFFDPVSTISNAIPYVRGRRLPILGTIPAGAPILAAENIEGYDYADVPEGEDYFFLRVSGDSMINARIYDGDLVLIKMQPCADDGQIVVCMINGDEATLKRFHRQGDVVMLQPENPAYRPIIVPCKDFKGGEARILGVVVEVKFRP
jgi:repressor LexA